MFYNYEYEAKSFCKTFNRVIMDGRVASYTKTKGGQYWVVVA
jgi:hypothetical protein